MIIAETHLEGNQALQAPKAPQAVPEPIKKGLIDTIKAEISPF